MYRIPLIAGAFALLLSVPAFASGLVIDPFTTFPPTGGGGGDTPVVASSTSSIDTSPWTGVVINKPSGAVEGDLVIATSVSHAGPNSSTVTPPAGFTAIQGGAANPYSRLHSFFKVLGAGEPASWTTGAEQGSAAFGVSVRLTGASSIDASAYVESESLTTSVVCPSVTTSGPNRRILNILTAGVFSGGVTVTYAVGTSEVLTDITDAGTSDLRFAVVEFEQAEAGATGTRTHTLSVSGSSHICITVAVEP